MRQTRRAQRALSPQDEPHLIVRTLSIDYAHGFVDEGHCHPWAQLIYAQRGSIRALAAGEIWIVPPRRALWVPAQVDHQLTMLGPVELRTLYFPEPTPDSSEVRAMDVNGLFHELILRVCEMQWLDQREPSHVRLSGLLRDEMKTSKPTKLFLSVPQDERARALAEAFLKNENLEVELTQLLKQIGLTRRTAERLFLKETGMSPARWRRQTNLARSIECLGQGATVEEAAAVAGYGSGSAFSEAFKKTMGFAPSKI